MPRSNCSSGIGSYQWDTPNITWWATMVLTCCTKGCHNCGGHDNVKFHAIACVVIDQRKHAKELSSRHGRKSLACINRKEWSTNQESMLLQYGNFHYIAWSKWLLKWVYTSHIPSLHYMETVPHRDADTLLPLSNVHIAPGTIIQSDKWVAYNQVQRLSNVSSHDVVNHSVNFVEPITGAHKLKGLRGCNGNQLPSYLDEFMWRECHGTSVLLALQNIMRGIAVQYSV